VLISFAKFLLLPAWFWPEDDRCPTQILSPFFPLPYSVSKCEFFSNPIRVWRFSVGEACYPFPSSPPNLPGKIQTTNFAEGPPYRFSGEVVELILSLSRARSFLFRPPHLLGFMMAVGPSLSASRPHAYSPFIVVFLLGLWSLPCREWGGVKVLSFSPPPPTPATSSARSGVRPPLENGSLSVSESLWRDCEFFHRSLGFPSTTLPCGSRTLSFRPEMRPQSFLSFFPCFMVLNPSSSKWTSATTSTSSSFSRVMYPLSFSPFPPAARFSFFIHQ